MKTFRRKKKLACSHPEENNLDSVCAKESTHQATKISLPHSMQIDHFRTNLCHQQPCANYAISL